MGSEGAITVGGSTLNAVTVTVGMVVFFLHYRG
jgi:hypothetical protein